MEVRDDGCISHLALTLKEKKNKNSMVEQTNTLLRMEVGLNKVFV